MTDDYVFDGEGNLRTTLPRPMGAVDFNKWHSRDIVSVTTGSNGLSIRTGDVVRVTVGGVHTQAGDIGTVVTLYEFFDAAASAKVAIWRTGKEHLLNAKYIERVEDRDV